MHRFLQMVSVLRICLNFLQTRATFGRTVPGSSEKISTKSSGGNSAKDCGGLELSPEAPLLTWPLPYSPASLGPAEATALSGPPQQPASVLRWPTIRSPSSSSMSESLPWSCWLFRCRLLHLRDWPTPHSRAQTAIRSHQTGNITSLQTCISCSVAHPPFSPRQHNRRYFWRQTRQAKNVKTKLI